MKKLWAYCFTLIALVALDSIWLTLTAKSFYTAQLGFIFSTQVTWWPLFVFYPLYASGLFFFAVQPALKLGKPSKAVIFGAFIGLISFASYDLTNQATIAGWPFVVTVIDMLWGVTLSGLASGIATFFAKKLS